MSRKEWLQEEEAWQGPGWPAVPMPRPVSKYFPLRGTDPTSERWAPGGMTRPCKATRGALGGSYRPLHSAAGTTGMRSLIGTLPVEPPLPRRFARVGSWPLAAKEPGGRCGAALPSQRCEPSVEHCMVGKEVGTSPADQQGEGSTEFPAGITATAGKTSPSAAQRSSAQAPTKRQKRTESVISPGVNSGRSRGVRRKDPSQISPHSGQ